MILIELLWTWQRNISSHQTNQSNKMFDGLLENLLKIKIRLHIVNFPLSYFFFYIGRGIICKFWKQIRKCLQIIYKMRTSFSNKLIMVGEQHYARNFSVSTILHNSYQKFYYRILKKSYVFCVFTQCKRYVQLLSKIDWIHFSES